MRRYLPALPAIAVGATALFACAAPPSAPDPARARQQVFDTERAFAKTMAARDHAAFVTFLSPETIFFSGPRSLRGSQQVADQWKRFYEGPQAPFSWEPETVEVLDSGTLALSSGPVRDATGKIISTFNSIWRQESPGNWRIVFDKGSPACDPAP
jgi:ketosteroid isomerase-like protein